jgi:hypothetical protein
MGNVKYIFEKLYIRGQGAAFTRNSQGKVVGFETILDTTHISML